MIARGLFRGPLWVEQLSQIAGQFALIADSTVADLVVPRLLPALRERGLSIHLFTFPAGESSKTRRCKERLEDEMLERGIDRHSAVLAVGGGVTIDLAGFVAATYLRGIPWMAIPTTLLAMVDASHGGKVGLNTPHGKNLIGAYHLPQSVLIDPDLLTTLPEEQMRQGMAEVVKAALIGSPQLFERLERMGEELSLEVIEESIQIKLRVVREDPQERGLRRLLNFGHTIGHALEAATQYSLSHGDAVALGMRAEVWLSQEMGHLSEESSRAILNLLDRHRFPTHLSRDFESESFYRALISDKKSCTGRSRFVLLEGIGRPLSFGGAYCTAVPMKMIEEALSCIL